MEIFNTQILFNIIIYSSICKRILIKHNKFLKISGLTSLLPIVLNNSASSLVSSLNSGPGNGFLFDSEPWRYQESLE